MKNFNISINLKNRLLGYFFIIDCDRVYTIDTHIHMYI